MAEKEGLRLGPRSIGVMIGVAVLTIGGAGLGGFSLSSGASTEVMETKDIRTVVEQTIEELDSTMTMDEAEEWRAEQDRVEDVDSTLRQHGRELEKLQIDVEHVQDTVDGHTATLQAIADKVGASE